MSVLQRRGYANRLVFGSSWIDRNDFELGYHTKINPSQTKESIKVEGVSAPHRYLQVRIFNGDNPLLKLDEVSMHRRDTSLVFQAQSGQVYTLIGGNPKVGGANYDLAKSIQGIDEFTLPLVGLGPSTTIQHKEQIPPWTERHSTLLWIILVFAVGGMLILIVRNLKKVPSSREQS